MMRDSASEQRIEAVRLFDRFYTRTVGVLHERLLQSEFSLAEARVLFEVAQADQITASSLARALDLDAGYLSRILRDFENRGLLSRIRSKTDRRQSGLSLSHKGRRCFARLDERACEQIGAMLGELTDFQQSRLIESMQSIQAMLGGRPKTNDAYLVRSHQPGDMGWIVHRHGVLYAQEYGWDERFEGLVAGIVADFVKNQDPSVERAWIAESAGTNVGCVLLVKQTKRVAKLRLLLVEPAGRGRGIGTRLVAECKRFARQVGYRKIVLWTNDVLIGARKIYAAAGFQLVRAEPHHSFGQDLIGETWELAL
jgi:DNA-binding MarR family transcriptional regulator/N-acetylglutamate synthase-like GNAT family acetyltransferase